MGKAITVIEKIYASQGEPGLREPVQPRAEGAARLSVRADAGVTRLAGLRQSGSMKLLFPRMTGPAMQAVAVNTAGGVTGGDMFDLGIGAGAGTHLTMTTQAAERAYRAQPGQRGRIVNRVTVAASARVNWLPQETILFDGCALDRSLRIDMDQGASLLMAEPLVFGRTAMGETLRAASLSDRIEIRRAGKIAFLDAMKMDADVAAHLAQPAVGAGAGAMVTLVYIAPDAAARLTPLRAMLPDSAGASLIGDDILCARALAPDSFDLRSRLIPILNRLTGDALPRPWMI